MPDKTFVSPVDGAWLRMDSATNPMVINVVMVLDGPVAHSDLEALLTERLVSQARFRQRIRHSIVPLLPPAWEDDPHFDLGTHVHRVALPSPGDESALQDLVSDLMSVPLDRDRPLWQVYHVEGYPAGSVLIARVHHAVGDGVALVKLLLRLTDGGVAQRPEPPRVGVESKRALDPMGIAKLAGAKALSLGKMLLLSSDSQSALKGKLGVRKKVAWSRPFDVARLKGAAHARQAKLNDLVVASVSGALRAYLHEKGHVPSSLRALVPVYVQGHAKEKGDLGNHFGLVFLNLPVHISDVEDRISEAKRTMDEMKRAPDALTAIAVLAAMGMASEGIQKIGIDIFTRKASLLITNVPGPTETLDLLGRKLTNVLVWAPVSGEVALGVTLLSYGGNMRMGVSSDARVVADPHRIVGAFEEVMEATLSLG
ncbi:MAG: wax ester/triacylglycerol synthase family O-acyltransferase [Polyangiaceae bacterium]|nr:wax ester/triacylglycerol synthase family O-acyltransferase [Polyangiaceae bacterium]